MRRLTLALVLALAACAAPPPVAAFRKPGAPIWSSAAFTPARIAGDWQQAAVFASGKGAGCAPGRLRVDPGPAGLTVSGRLCLDGQQVALSGPLRPVGPGRLAVAGMEDWWVIWVDADYRTLAVATPSGRFGFVLDRGKIGPDRLKAAGEIFDFNGYPKARMIAY